MNYQKIYNQLISKRQNDIPNCYTEKHHIIPKCMCGSNKKINLVKLSAREHFIAHLLLSKIYGGKLLYAVKLMITVNKYNSKKYEWLRILHSKEVSLNQKGRKHSEETKLKMSISAKNKPPVSDDTRKKISDCQKGKTLSEETKLKMSESHEGITFSEEHKQNISSTRKGMKFTDEHKKNISLAQTGKKISRNKNVVQKGKSYVVTDTNNSEVLVNNLKNFCTTNDLNYLIMVRNINNGKIVVLARTTTSDSAKNCVGWEIRSI